ncbi:MAG: NAD(P)H-binding protein [Solirubrobacteraceae bacterium]
MNVLVTGITGCVGSELAPRLRHDGHSVRGFSRAPARAPARAPGSAASARTSPGPAEPAIPVCVGDAVSGAGLRQALRGIDVAYYLIHSMEPSRNERFSERERAAAENFARAARDAGVQRIVYLGGLAPAEARPSAHLASRLAVEELLRAGAPCSVALRASIVIGARSRSFRFLVRLVERLPVLAVPAWRCYRTRPIDERDVIELLARAATVDEVCGCSLDVGGPDVVSYGELIDRIRDHMLVDRPTINFKRITMNPIASRIAALIAGEEHALIGPLMEGLQQDLLPRDDHAATALRVTPHTLDAAIEHALREWEATEPLAAR